MPTAGNILAHFFRFAPERGKVDGDNVGLLAGDSRAEVTKTLIALDATGWTIGEAIEYGAELLLVHHPVIHGKISRVNDETITGRNLLAALRAGLSVVSMHTNLDAAADGVNQALAEVCGLRDLSLPDMDAGFYDDGTPYAIGRLGYLAEPATLAEYLPVLKSALKSNGLRYHDAGRAVRFVAVCGGSGGGEVRSIFDKGCDTYVTSDIKYGEFLEAKELGLNLIDADHFCTENVVTAKLLREMLTQFPDVRTKISERHAQTAQFFV